MDLFSLAGKVAIVTGGNQGIGLAISKGYAEAGATVIIVNRRETEGRKAAENISGPGLTVKAIAADVSDQGSVDRLVSAVVEEFGKIDILVNNAGVICRTPPEDFTEEEWNRLFDTNLKGLFYCCQAVGREMIKRKTGKIINVTSNVSEIVMPGRSIYATTKAGAAQLTRALAIEWSQYGIYVNALGPGPTFTDINKKHFEDNPEDLQARIDSIPLGRMGVPEDHIGAAIFLASDASNFITGQNLLVDGGSTIW